MTCLFRNCSRHTYNDQGQLQIHTIANAYLFRAASKRNLIGAPVPPPVSSGNSQGNVLVIALLK